MPYLLCLLRLYFNTTEDEREHDSATQPFWILDCGFWIAGEKFRKRSAHRFVLLDFNPKSKIENPKFI
jgi:hypothetical protein